MRCSYLGGFGLLFALFNFSIASENVTFSPWLTSDFTFNWTPQKDLVSVPTTAQCDKLNITWNPQNNGSPDPAPPYAIHIYTSTLTYPISTLTYPISTLTYPISTLTYPISTLTYPISTLTYPISTLTYPISTLTYPISTLTYPISTLTYPIIVDAGTFSPFEWTDPFPPDTQYQICMFDSRGHTGGCQTSYTVMPPRNSSQRCDETYSIPTTLSVQGATEIGSLTPYGWPDQCRTISLMAQNGTPPFIMTVAPSLHPPLNLTFNDHGPMDWTVTLGWAMQFWISLTDSTGASWAYGPLHSGGNGPTDCLHLSGDSLTVQLSTTGSHHVSVGAAVGIAIGALALGVISTLLLEWLWTCRRKHHKTNEVDHEVGRAVTQAISSQPGIEPYPIAAIRSQEQIELRSNEENSVVSGRNNDSQVYVVHHDAGGVPVTIYTAGRDVQELPPHYTTTSSEPQTSHAPSSNIDSSGQSNETRHAKPTT